MNPIADVCRLGVKILAGGNILKEWRTREAPVMSATRITCACAMMAAALTSSFAQQQVSAQQQTQQVSAELAKKCREMAVKAHPTQLAGTSPYAAAQREYFRQCIAKGGNMDK
jgi:hypothetical protein